MGGILLFLLVAGVIAFALYVHFRLVGKEPSPFEFKDEHLVRMAENVPVEGPGRKPGSRRIARYAIALTDTRFAMFQWGKPTVNIPHENADWGKIRQSGDKLLLDLRQGGKVAGVPGVYNIHVDKPALWAAEVRRWREMAGGMDSEEAE